MIVIVISQVCMYYIITFTPLKNKINATLQAKQKESRLKEFGAKRRWGNRDLIEMILVTKRGLEGKQLQKSEKMEIRNVFNRYKIASKTHTHTHTCTRTPKAGQSIRKKWLTVKWTRLMDSQLNHIPSYF